MVCGGQINKAASTAAITPCSCGCECIAVGDSFDTWNLAFAFPAGIDASIVVTLWSQAIITQQQQYALLDSLQEQYVRIEGYCSADNVAQQLDGITFSQVSLAKVA